jgi:hypothetical protein
LNWPVLGILVALVVVVVLVALALRAYLRRGGDETHSVDNYRHTLHTLSDMRSRSTTRTVRVVGEEDEAAARAEGDAAGGSSGVFEDPEPHSPVSPPQPRRHDRALSAMNRGPRRMAVPIVVGVVVVVLLAGVLVVGARSRHHHPSASSQNVATSTSTTASHRDHRTTEKQSTSTTTTATVPTRFAPIAATSLTATYRPPADVYSLTLSTTTSDCWVTASSASGSSLLSETLLPGQTKTLSVTGAAKLIIGAPSSLVVTLDHEPVVLPTGYGTPFTMTLQPATA